MGGAARKEKKDKAKKNELKPFQKQKTTKETESFLSKHLPPSKTGSQDHNVVSSASHELKAANEVIQIPIDEFGFPAKLPFHKIQVPPKASKALIHLHSFPSFQKEKVLKGPSDIADLFCYGSDGWHFLSGEGKKPFFCQNGATIYYNRHDDGFYSLYCKQPDTENKNKKSHDELMLVRDEENHKEMIKKYFSSPTLLSLSGSEGRRLRAQLF